MSFRVDQSLDSSSKFTNRLFIIYLLTKDYIFVVWLAICYSSYFIFQVRGFVSIGWDSFRRRRDFFWWVSYQEIVWSSDVRDFMRSSRLSFSWRILEIKASYPDSFFVIYRRIYSTMFYWLTFRTSIADVTFTTSASSSRLTLSSFAFSLYRIFILSSISLYFSANLYFSLLEASTALSAPSFYRIESLSVSSWFLLWISFSLFYRSELLFRLRKSSTSRFLFKFLKREIQSFFSSYFPLKRAFKQSYRAASQSFEKYFSCFSTFEVLQAQKAASRSFNGVTISQFSKPLAIPLSSSTKLCIIAFKHQLCVSDCATKLLYFSLISKTFFSSCVYFSISALMDAKPPYTFYPSSRESFAYSFVRIYFSIALDSIEGPCWVIDFVVVLMIQEPLEIQLDSI